MSDNPPTQFRVWLEAARPKTLGAGIAPVIIGGALAWSEGAFHALSVVAALTGSLLIQIGTNFANDYFDFVKGADTEERVGPVRATATGLVSPDAMKRAMVIALTLVFIPGVYILCRGGLPFLAVGLISIACGVLYTGGPFPLGYLGLGDLFVLIFFGPVAVGGTYYLQTQSIDGNILIAGLAPGLFSVAILTVNNLRDVDGDRLAGKKTLAVRFGTSFAKAEYLCALLIGGAVVPGYLCFASGGHHATLAGAAVLFPAIPVIRRVFTQTGPALNAALASTGKLLLLFSVLFSVGWALS
ncbi:MAG: 1,4-dihydroxy-2-naphthoate polyprenyltransferase [Candidatus Hydrogenedentes bacterium]|jgi:1,4-dihydroxy-2-naphthoate octaprenyltransferase|nr:1,4-dihydroxy-2-naphthoate polyprenyltransferase [Candidatus Hydrogenedentota bacterium]